MSKERLTRFVTPVGKCMTTLNSLKHYMPCVTCRNNAKIKTDANGEQYTEKFNFCDTCEVKMLFNRLKEYEDLEEQGLLLRLPCKVGDTVWVPDRDGKPREMILDKPDIRCHCAKEDNLCMALCDRKTTGVCVRRLRNDGSDIGKTVFLTQAEAEEKLRELEEK